MTQLSRRLLRLLSPICVELIQKVQNKTMGSQAEDVMRIHSNNYPNRLLVRLIALFFTLILGVGMVAIILTLLGRARLAHAGALCVRPGGEDGCVAAITTALALAGEDEVIRVAAGTYVENVVISRTVTLQGGWAPDFSIRNLSKFSATINPADNTQSVVSILGHFGDPGAVVPTLDGFVISGGRADLGSNHGGGLRIVDSNALVISNTIRDNTAFLLGGGVWVQRGAPVLQGNQIMNNQSVGLGQDAHGGGVQLENTQAALLDNLIASNIVSGTQVYGGGLEIAGSGVGQVDLRRNQFISNTASIDPSHSGFGGALAVNSGKVLLEGSSVFSNTASAGGGGVWIGAGGSISFTNSVAVANLAGGDGGAILNSGVISISNATISGNSADGMGGGIANFNQVNLVNATIADNASSNGAGVFNASLVNTLNTLLALNLGDNCLGVLISQGHNLEDGGTCALGQPSDMSNTSASLDPLGDNGGLTPTHALGEDSPALDAGDNSACPELDQRGVPRPLDGNGDGQAVCDIGAFESPTPSALVILTDEPDPSRSGEPFMVTFSVTATVGLPTGAVTVTVENESQTCSGMLVGGAGSCALTLTVPGTHTLMATFISHDNNFISSTASEVHTVEMSPHLYLPVILRE